MARILRLRLLSSLRRFIHTDPSNVTTTEVLHVINEATLIRILDLAMRIGDAMLAVGASAHEVTLAVARVARAYGLGTVHVNVTYDSITVSHHRGEDDWPTTLMRVVKMMAPDHSKLQRLQALIVSIEEGRELDDARLDFRAIRRTPFVYRPAIVLLSQAVLAVGISIMFGASPVIMASTFVAALCAALTQAGLAKTRVPLFFSQIAGGFAVTVVAMTVSALGNAGIEPFVGVRASIIVASGIMLMLAGIAVVGAAQDAIDGFALTANGRILDVMLRTLGVVLGILFGLELGRVLGFYIALPSDAQDFGPPLSLAIGALIASVAVAVSNGAGFKTSAVSGALSIVAILGYIASVSLDLNVAVASGIGALVASFVGVFVAHRLHVPSVAVTTAAIIPLVPGSAVFRGLLGVVHSDGTDQSMLLGASSLTLAAMIGIALAAGASLGISLGTPVQSTLKSVVRGRAGVRR